ncbi:MAG: Beta-lactamase-like protein [uncultured bacterium]|nr:MAG: Beta-lactamase-like protein [uncultured bacterium]
MKIKFLGAAGTVTGSSYILTSGGGTSILIDLGMFQGPAEINKLNYLPYDYDVSLLSGAILTHAHLDHCGRSPILMTKGFKGNIYMTPPTRDLTELSLLDSAKIAKEDKSQILYTTSDVLALVKQFVTVEYHKEIHIGDFIVVLRDAGHILGSASLEIIDKNSNSEIHKIIFSADIGNYPAYLEDATEFIKSGDAVVIETTYGDRLHLVESPVEALQSEINAVEINGGTLLIPSFSLDRAQELMHMIMHLKKEGKVQNETPVILDSPMAEKATKIYVDYPKYFNPHIEAEYKLGEMFDFPGLEVTKDWRQSQAIHARPEAKVIIAGAGMMTGGRIVGHAIHYLPMASTRLMIVGYQGEGSLGRELLNGKTEVIIKGQKVLVNASVHDTQGLSSHADQGQLMEWLKAIKGVKMIILTHGDDHSRIGFKEKVESELGITDINLPELGDEIQF